VPHGRSSDGVAKFDEGELVAVGEERAEKTKTPGNCPGLRSENTGDGRSVAAVPGSGFTVQVETDVGVGVGALVLTTGDYCIAGLVVRGTRKGRRSDGRDKRGDGNESLHVQSP
jgi:hypothetical protein